MKMFFDETVLTAWIANVHLVNDWIIDTGVSGGSILMGNDAVSQTIGIGTISIKCHDGVVRILGDVRHVPDLRMIISLGSLASLGCKFSGEGDS